MDTSAFSFSAAAVSDLAFPPPNLNSYQSAAVKAISPPTLGPSPPRLCWSPAKSYSSTLSSLTRSCIVINNIEITTMCWGIIKQSKSFLKKQRNKTLHYTPSINYSPVTFHTPHPPPLHTPLLQSCDLHIRSAVSLTPPCSSIIQERCRSGRADHSAAKQKGIVCRTAPHHTEMLQQTLSQLQPCTVVWPQSRKPICPLQDQTHRLYPLLGCGAKHRQCSPYIGTQKGNAKVGGLASILSDYCSDRTANRSHLQLIFLT